LGKLKVVGLTTNALKESITKQLESHLKNPVVTIRLENFRITVLGEVKSPGAFAITSERISIPEAIGLAGDLTIQGKRKNVLLIRNNNGTIEKVTIDLTDQSLFTSPYYYLAQNDILYIEPNKAKVNSSAIGTTASLISIATAILSVVLILTR
jgi:polysaccharide export outer membrane protein